MAVTSTISFGGYNFPSSFQLVSSDQPTSIDEMKIPYLDGSQIPQGTRDTKTVKIKGTIGGVGAVNSGGAYINSSDLAAGELNLLESYLNTGYQQLNVTSSPARTLLCQKTDFTASYQEATQRTVIDVEITFKAQDPRWLASTGSSSSATSGNLTSNGTAIVYPKFTLTAFSSSASIAITPAGASGAITLALSLSALAGQTVTIDCDPRNRANAVVGSTTGVALYCVNAASCTDNSGGASFFPYLLPGNNALSVTGITAMTTAWNDAWSF
jgi:hypothetical protein